MNLLIFFCILIYDIRWDTYIVSKFILYKKKANKPCDKNFTSTLSRNDGCRSFLFFFFFFHFIISKLNIFRYLTFIYRHATFIQNALPLNSSFFFYLKTNKRTYTFNYSNEKIQNFYTLCLIEQSVTQLSSIFYQI